MNASPPDDLSESLADVDEFRLAALAKRRAWEQIVHETGCLIGVSLGVFLCWLVLLIAPLGASNAANIFRVTAAMVGFIAAPIAGKYLLQKLANARGRAYREELQGRYGQLTWIRQAKFVQARLHPGELSILLRVRAEQGIGRYGELVLTPNVARIRVVTGAEFDFGLGVPPRDHYTQDVRELSANELAQLRSAWTAAMSKKPRHVKPADELLSEKTQAAIVHPDVMHPDKPIRAWSAHSPEALAPETGDPAWTALLTMAFALLAERPANVRL